MHWRQPTNWSLSSRFNLKDNLGGNYITYSSLTITYFQEKKQYPS
nr:MAG TPA: hypothetical protein [Caudoviricetes sp.]